jgi:stearoyl-CoA desaturase (Delta-9 desaturase)
MLLLRPRDSVRDSLAAVDVSDLTRNRWLGHQQAHFYLYALGCGVLLPTLSGLLVSLSCGQACYVLVVLRLVLVYHTTWCVNSVAHTFGTRPYSTTIEARQNWLLALVSGGEGWHNYHHVYPGDWRGDRGRLWNTTRSFIHAMMWCGLARD